MPRHYPKVTKAYPPNPKSKTGRPYGAIVTAVRHFLFVRGRSFTRLDIEALGFTNQQARSAIATLSIYGEITRIRLGKVGNKGFPPVYAALRLRD